MSRLWRLRRWQQRCGSINEERGWTQHARVSDDQVRRTDVSWSLGVLEYWCSAERCSLLVVVVVLVDTESGCLARHQPHPEFAEPHVGH